MKVQDYIREKLPLTLRENKMDDGTLIGLPYPYTVPCADGIFNELYYWDTYFTNKALFAFGNIEQAKYNVSDILYPNLWAPCQYIAVKALEYYGYSDEAKRIARKYAKLIECNFEIHGKMFEKYNGLTGGIDAVSEYGTPEMLGWTAGVYMECKKRV